MMAMTALLVQQVLLVQPGQWGKLVRLAQLVQLEIREPLAKQVLLAQRVQQALREIKVIQAQKGQRVLD